MFVCNGRKSRQIVWYCVATVRVLFRKIRLSSGGHFQLSCMSREDVFISLHDKSLPIFFVGGKGREKVIGQLFVSTAASFFLRKSPPSVWPEYFGFSLHKKAVISDLHFPLSHHTVDCSCYADQMWTHRKKNM